MKLKFKSLPVFTLTALTVLLADQFSKLLARNKLSLDRPLDVIKGFFSLTLVKNTGVAFGLLKGRVSLFQIAAIAIIVVIFIYLFIYKPASMVIRIALGLIVAGSLGNFLDRALFKQVTDFIDFHIWPVFNVADSSIVAGASLLLAKTFLGKSH